MINSNYAPDFLRSKSAAALRRMMLMNNARKGAFFKYDIVWVDKESMWYAWFYKEPDLKEMMDEPSE